MSKRAQGLSINVIIVAALALIVLVVLIMLIMGSGRKVTEGTSGCLAVGGLCKQSRDCTLPDWGRLSEHDDSCKASGEVCCRYKFGQ